MRISIQVVGDCVSNLYTLQTLILVFWSLAVGWMYSEVILAGWVGKVLLERTAASKKRVLMWVVEVFIFMLIQIFGDT